MLRFGNNTNYVYIEAGKTQVFLVKLRFQTVCLYVYMDIIQNLIMYWFPDNAVLPNVIKPIHNPPLKNVA